MGFPVVLKKKQMHFPGVNQKQGEFSRGVIKKKSYGTSIRVQVLGLKNSDECNTYLWSSQGTVWNFQGKVKKLKNLRGFFEKVAQWVKAL